MKHHRPAVNGPLLAALASLVIASAFAAPLKAPLTPAASRAPAPAFQLHDAKGGTVSLAAYRGRVLVLNFWATECGGCRLELPWLVEIQQSFKEKNVALLGISMDISYEDLKSANEAWARVQPFVAAHRLTYPILMGDEPVTHAYNVNALPATYLIDKRGRVAATYLGLIDKSNVEANLSALLQELP